jgi:hypothetical protein
MTATSSGAIERLNVLHSAYLAAFGDASHPLVTLMRAAIASSSESVAAAVVQHVEGERAKTQEALALAVVARELDADKRPPTLWVAVDVEGVRPVEMQTLEQALKRDAAIRVGHEWRRESEKMIDGSPLAARILFPAHSGATGHVEAAGRILGQFWRHWVAPMSDARGAMLVAALERTANAKK